MKTRTTFMNLLFATAASLLPGVSSAGVPDVQPYLAPPSPPFTLHMSPHGSDSWDGLTPGTALQTLNGVHTKITEYKPTIDQNIEVRIQYVSNMPYLHQHVKWTHTSPNYTISFMPADYDYDKGVHDIAGRPVFDGRGLQRWFFELRSSKGEATNLRFYYIQVQGYPGGGIGFVGGQRHSERALWNGYNTVYGCYFYKLGNKNYSWASAGFAAVDLGNSDHNLIRNNVFRNLENRPETASYIHGVYLASSSGHNLIIKNSFSYVSGDPIKVRDYSNYNQIFSNVFTRTGQTAFFHDSPSAGECSSWKNEFRYNVLHCGYPGHDIKVFQDSPDPSFPRGEQGPHCPARPEWLYTSRNDRFCP